MIPVFRPSYDDREVAAVGEVLKSGWVGLGPKTKEFEEAFAAYIGTRFAVATNSCTAALHLAMVAMGVEGREVVSTPMTFVSTNHAVLYCGGKPVFCDIEPDTLNVDAGLLAECVTPRTRAIVVVHYGGHPCDMDPILEIAAEHGLKVVEDCAHACGSEYRRRRVGSIGDVGCFSFHAVKNLATGEGGMLTTDDPEVYERLMRLRWMGITKDTWSREERDVERYSWYYDVTELGFKYHMSDIAAAIGLVQLDKLDEMNAKRRAVWRTYDGAFADLEWLKTPTAREYVTELSAHNYVVQLDRRDELNAFLKDRGVSTGVHYIPNNHYAMYDKCPGETPRAEEAWRKILSLPIFPDLAQDDLMRVVEAVREFGSSGHA